MDHISISDWWFGTFLIFPYIGNVIIPTDFHIFQRGRSTTKQIFIRRPHFQYFPIDHRPHLCSYSSDIPFLVTRKMTERSNKYPVLDLRNQGEVCWSPVKPSFKHLLKHVETPCLIHVDSKSITGRSQT